SNQIQASGLILLPPASPVAQGGDPLDDLLFGRDDCDHASVLLCHRCCQTMSGRRTIVLRAGSQAQTPRQARQVSVSPVAAPASRPLRHELSRCLVYAMDQERLEVPKHPEAKLSPRTVVHRALLLAITG